MGKGGGGGGEVERTGGHVAEDLGGGTPGGDRGEDGGEGWMRLKGKRRRLAMWKGHPAKTLLPLLTIQSLLVLPFTV